MDDLGTVTLTALGSSNGKPLPKNLVQKIEGTRELPGVNNDLKAQINCS